MVSPKMKERTPGIGRLSDIEKGEIIGLIIVYFLYLVMVGKEGISLSPGGSMCGFLMARKSFCHPTGTNIYWVTTFGLARLAQYSSLNLDL